MAWAPLFGLKPLFSSAFQISEFWINGLGSPFGIETYQASMHKNTIERLNGHLAVIQMVGSLSRISVSIPNGLPRPFSPMEFLQDRWNKMVSIPNGLPRPF